MANSKNITFDQLQAALSRVKSALDGKANTSHGNHVPKTETANNAKFLRNDNTWQTVTPVNIGAADRSHTHGEYINQNTFTNVKIGDTTIEADSPTDTLTLTAGANVTLTPDATNDTVTIAAKDTVYTHPTTSGNRHIPSGGSSGQILRWSEDGTAAWGSENNSFASGSVGGFTVTPNNLVGDNVGMTSSSGHGFALWAGANGADASNNAPFRVGHDGHLYAYDATLAGTLDGNATTATRLQAAHKFTIGNTERYFDGSADVSWTLGEIGAASVDHIHTNINHLGNVFAQSTGERASKDGLSMQLVYNNGYPYPYGNVLNLKGTGDGQLFVAWSGTTGAHAPVYVRSKRDSGDAWSDWAQFYTTANPQTDITGNAGTATKLATAKTITIGNTGKQFDGSGNVSWSLDEMGVTSAIAQSGNSILNTVSNTYATKAELNDLEIGGTNLVLNSSFLRGATNWSINGVTWDDITTIAESTSPTGNALKITVNSTNGGYGIFQHVTPRKTGNYTLSFYAKADTDNYNINAGQEGSAIKDFVLTTNWTKYTYTYNRAQLDSNAIIFYTLGNTDNGAFYIHSIKLEYGNKATDWTPAPEDIDESITAVDNKFANYSTTNQMNSAIQVAENDAKMDIRHNYVTKHEVAHYFEGENKWKLDVYSLGSMSASATPTKELMIQNNCQYQRSYLVEHPSYEGDKYGDNYVGYATTYMHFTEAHQWNGRVVTDDNGNVYLNDVLVLSTPTCQWADITLNFKAGWNKLEVLYAEGTYGDGWQFDSEIVVVPGGIMDKMNCYGQNSIVADWAYGSVGGTTTINGDKIQTNTITANQLAMSDFSNFSQLRPRENLSNRYGSANWGGSGEDYHFYWANGDSEYLPFTINETANPFKVGDKVGFKFEAYAQVDLDVTIGIWFYTSDNCDGYLADCTAAVHLYPGWNSYSVQVTIDCIQTKLARSVAIMMKKGATNYVEVRNVVISRAISNVMIEDRAVTANKLGTIGGFQVEDRLLRGRNGTEGNNYVGMSGDGFEWAFWAGAYNGLDAPFHVGHDGYLYATNATLAGTLDGNATTASRLQNARTFTIGNTGKNFDGSGNMSWSLGEIGAIGAKGSEGYWGLTDPYDNDHEWIRTTALGLIPYASGSNSGLGTDSWRFNQGYIDYIHSAEMWSNSFHGYLDGTAYAANKLNSRGVVQCETGTDRSAVDGLSTTQVYNSGHPTLYGNVLSLRGMGDGQILVGWSGTSGAHAPVYVRSKRDNGDAPWSDWAQFYTTAHPQSDISGNAGSASRLQYARTFTVGNTGKNFDGSGNMSWSLGEIGALPTAGGTVSGNLNVTGAFSIGGKKITINSSAPSSPAVGDIWIKI